MGDIFFFLGEGCILNSGLRGLQVVEKYLICELCNPVTHLDIFFFHSIHSRRTSAIALILSAEVPRRSTI